MVRHSALSGSASWDETFTITEIIGAYRHPRHGRVLEFFTDQKQSRTVAILDIELATATIRRLQRQGLHP